VKRARAVVARSARAAGILARDRRVPRPLRWIAGLALLPIPGPFDELVFLLVAPVIAIFYREPMRDAWQAAG
jgi:hypothetical protein